METLQLLFFEQNSFLSRSSLRKQCNKHANRTALSPLHSSSPHVLRGLTPPTDHSDMMGAHNASGTLQVG